MRKLILILIYLFYFFSLNLALAQSNGNVETKVYFSRLNETTNENGYFIYLILWMDDSNICNLIHIGFDSLNLELKLNKFLSKSLESATLNKEKYTYGTWKELDKRNYSFEFEDGFDWKCTISDGKMTCNEYILGEKGVLTEIQRDIVFNEFKLSD